MTRWNYVLVACGTLVAASVLLDCSLGMPKENDIIGGSGRSDVATADGGSGAADTVQDGQSGNDVSSPDDSSGQSGDEDGTVDGLLEDAHVNRDGNGDGTVDVGLEDARVDGSTGDNGPSQGDDGGDDDGAEVGAEVGVEVGPSDDGGTPEPDGGADSDGVFNPNKGLIAFYPFTEATSTSSADMVHPADSTRNAIFVGTVTRTTSLRTGRSVAVRNSGAVDYIQLPAGLFDGLSATTVTLWAWNRSITRPNARFFDFGSSSASTLSFVDLARDPNNIESHLVRLALPSIDPIEIWTPRVYPDGGTSLGWTHFAVTWDESAINFYVNGVLVGTKSSPGAVPSALQTPNNYLANSQGAVYSQAYAEFDDVRIYNHALSSSEISELFMRY